MTKAKFIKFIIATILAVAALFIPYESLGIDGPNTLNPIEIRVIAIFVMAALYWILQPFPIWTTSTLVIVLMILTVSNSAFLPFRVEGVEPMKYKDIMNTWSDQTIMLFLGGFFRSRYKIQDGLEFGARSFKTIRAQSEICPHRFDDDYGAFLDVHEQHGDRCDDACYFGSGAQTL